MAEGVIGATDPLDISQIKSWRSIITLIVFVIANIIVLFPFHVPVYIPRVVYNAFLDTLSFLRIIPPRQHRYHHHHGQDAQDGSTELKGPFLRFWFPLNIVTAPLIADLFLLAIKAIGRQEVHDGTYGANSIDPLDIMIFFITLAYIAISLDASGLIRYLAFKVLQWGGKVGHRLFFYLYAFFFLLGSFIGNDPIILSGTAFLAYMTRVSSNIVHPRAWIHAQFAVANIASAILVSSNPTNLVLAKAFGIQFTDYTLNMIVPVVITAITLFPFLLYIVFANESLIPISIKMHELPEEARARKPVNPNIPHARGTAEVVEEDRLDEQAKLLSLEEIMNPFLDKGGAMFGAVIMGATLITILAMNAAKEKIGEQRVFYVTLPGAVVMFLWDLGFGWYHRHETREIARRGRLEVERARAEKARREREESQVDLHTTPAEGNATAATGSSEKMVMAPTNESVRGRDEDLAKKDPAEVNGASKGLVPGEMEFQRTPAQHATLLSMSEDAYRWAQETFPTAMAVIAHLPFVLIPFAFSMFVLVQALVTKGWVEVFAYGWDNWVRKTGTIGTIGGMGFLSVVLCNFSGTNIGTTILLSRVIQSWQLIHSRNHTPISNRDFWATVYSMALGVNYGAFSTALSASLAGLLWRDILAKKHIRIRRLDFARVNLPIIAIAMTVGCLVLVGEVYIFRDESPYLGLPH